MQTLSVAAEDVTRRGVAEPTRRPQPQQRVKPEQLAVDALRRYGAERVRADEHRALRPPEGDLGPDPAVANREEVEGGACDRRPRHRVERHAEPPRERLAVAPVPVEQLNHARRLAGRADPLVDALAVDRVDDPDVSRDDERVRAAVEEAVLDPAEGEGKLVAEADRHSARARDEREPRDHVPVGGAEALEPGTSGLAYL